VGFVFNPKYVKSYLNGRYNNYITIGPSLGRNAYDKFMLGAFVTNYKFPLNSFKFFAAPMYAFGSKRMTGIGRIDYSIYPKKSLRKINLFLAYSNFSMNQFTDSAGKDYFLSFEKFAPGIRFTFREKDPRSTMHRFLQWKSYFIKEGELRFKRDSIPSPPGFVTRITTENVNRYLNQLTLVIENNRALYPYHGELKFEQAKEFYRAGFTGNYFFNYRKEGGLSTRLFAGKFFYAGSKTIDKEFLTDRYHLNMTGPIGFEDYTYSDYFIGRNEFEGFPSQQIMMRDGGFKIRTDLLADKVGKTDDWLIATNLAATIPSGLNPLSLLPVKIPLKIFFDLGTYADAWKSDFEGDRFLYEAGVQLSVFKDLVNFYVPILYSKVYRDYFQTVLEKKGRFWKTISFNIDISNFNLRKIDRNLNF
jgi:hypothetical protein